MSVAPTFRQAVIVEPRRVEIVVRDLAPLPPNSAMIKVESCGICGSDLTMYRGYHPVIKPPIAFGHEVIGTLVAVNGGTDGAYALGDRVAFCHRWGAASAPHVVGTRRVLRAHEIDRRPDSGRNGGLRRRADRKSHKGSRQRPRCSESSCGAAGGRRPCSQSCAVAERRRLSCAGMWTDRLACRLRPADAQSRPRVGP
jgi:hypothetical protein